MGETRLPLGLLIVPDVYRISGSIILSSGRFYARVHPRSLGRLPAARLISPSATSKSLVFRQITSTITTSGLMTSTLMVLKWDLRMSNFP